MGMLALVPMWVKLVAFWRQVCRLIDLNGLVTSVMQTSHQVLFILANCSLTPANVQRDFSCYEGELPPTHTHTYTRVV
jgi:hypothetical protein